MTLRFRDRDLERAFLADFFEHVRTPIRIAFGLAVAMWVLWGSGANPSERGLASRRGRRWPA